MVSSQHEAMHRLFQHDPGTFARAFRALGPPFPEPLEVLLLSTDLTEPAPVERNYILRVLDRHGIPVSDEIRTRVLTCTR